MQTFPTGILRGPEVPPLAEVPLKGLPFAVIHGQEAGALASGAPPGFRDPEGHAVRRGLQLLQVLEGGAVSPPAVVHQHQLHVPAGAGARLGVMAVNLVDDEDAPDALNFTGTVSQDPLPAHAHGAEPPAVFLKVMVHHSEKLFYRRGLLRVGELVSNGLGQGALRREKAVPNGGIGQIQPSNQKEQAADAADCQGHIIHGFKISPVLLQPHQEQAEHRRA